MSRATSQAKRGPLMALLSHIAALMWATPLNDPAAVGMSVSGVIEDGMAQMSAKFREMGGQVYLDAEKVKESNKVL